MSFFARHPRIKSILAGILKASLATGMAYLICAAIPAGLSVDFVKGFCLSAGGLSLAASTTRSIIELCKGVANKRQVNQARADSARTKEDIERGIIQIKDPNQPTLQTTVPNLGGEVARLTSDCNIAKTQLANQKLSAKASGEAIINIINSSATLNRLLIRNVELQTKENEAAAVQTKLIGGTATQTELETTVNEYIALLRQQKTDNASIRSETGSITNEATRLL